jgi:hypothetical protein
MIPHFYIYQVKEWPTREDYEARKREEALIRQYLSDFDPEHHVGAFDPVQHYSDMTRKESENYKTGALAFLKREFPLVTLPAIKVRKIKVTSV